MVDRQDENASKKKKSEKRNTFRSFLHETLSAFHPRQWTLRTRLLYLPGCLIVLFVILLLFYLNQAFTVQARHSAVNQLFHLSSWINNTINVHKNYLLNESLATAYDSEMASAFAGGNRAKLNGLLLQNLERKLKYSEEKQHLQYHFYQPPAVSFYQNSGGPVGEDLSGAKPMVVKANREQRSFSGLECDSGGISIVAVSPVYYLEKHVGAVEVRMNLENTLENLEISMPFGMLLLRGPEKGKTGDVPQVPDPAGQQILLSRGHVKAEVAELPFFSPSTLSGRYLYKAIDLKGVDAASAGKIVLVYDSSADIGIYHKEIFSFLLIFGSVLLILILYSNLVNISSFFSLLKKILIDSFSNDFVKRFESDHIHCLHVLNCSHNECPVHQNPSLVCYLETGSLAISPKWRNTCIFLNKYNDCVNCPVYNKRIRDELNEMRNVVNTIMHLWSDFLCKIENILAEADVLRSFAYQHKKLSLDNVSTFLEQMAKVANFGRDLQGARDEEEVYKQLAFVLEKEFSIDYYLILGVNRRDNTMRVMIDNRNVDPLCINEVSINADLCRAKRVGEVVCSYNNNMLCPYFNIDHKEYHRYCIPMVMGGSVGVILSFLAPPKQLDTRRKQITLLRKYLEECAPILNSLRLLKLLRNQTLKDPLTQCYNRRFLDDYINQYEPLAKRNKSEIGLLLLDLDLFKIVNDEYGHPAGDQILKEIVTLIRDQIRESDLLIRYGGEEFLIILLEVKNSGSSENVAEKIRGAVEQHQFRLTDGIIIQKTVSIGVAVFPEDGDSINQTIKFADVALYEAKQTGRNKVVRFKPEMWQKWYRAIKSENPDHDFHHDYTPAGPAGHKGKHAAPGSAKDGTPPSDTRAAAG